MPLTSSKISFFFDDVSISLKNRTGLKSFLEAIFKKEKKKLDSLNYIFCTDKRLLQINREYLGHDYFTDIITFDLSESKEKSGEVYISVDRVRENAKLLNLAQNQELIRVMIHGVLHLCGYKDSTASQQKQMRSKEDYYLEKYQTT